MDGEPSQDGQKAKVLRDLGGAFQGLGKRMDTYDKRAKFLEEKIADLTGAVDELTNVLSMYADLMAQAAQHPRPFDMLCSLMREVLSQRRR